MATVNTTINAQFTADIGDFLSKLQKIASAFSNNIVASFITLKKTTTLTTDNACISAASKTGLTISDNSAYTGPAVVDGYYWFAIGY